MISDFSIIRRYKFITNIILDKAYIRIYLKYDLIHLDFLEVLVFYKIAYNSIYIK